MWDRVLFFLRRSTVDLGSRLGSWRLSIVLMVLAALYYALLAIWSTSSPPHVVQNIAALTPFWIVYALLLINTGVCLWNRLPGLRRDLSPRPRWSERTPDWRIDLGRGMTRSEARQMLRRHGYRPSWHDDDRVGGVRRRWAALGTYLFHGAFFLVAVAFLLTLVGRQDSRVWVAEGEDFESRSDQFLSTSVPRILSSAAPPIGFRVERIVPEFWRDQLLFTSLAADLTLADGSNATTRINRPLWVGPATFLRLSGFGYTPRYELVDRQGRVLDTAFVKLNVFPPGQRDYFVVPDYPHRFHVEVLPDFALQDGSPVNRSLNLDNPGIALSVARGRIRLGQAFLSTNEAFEFEGLRLRFPEIRYWGEFSVISDPGVPILFVGFLVGLSGLLLKLPGRRQEAEWRDGQAEAGSTIVGWGGRPPRNLPPVDHEV